MDIEKALQIFAVFSVLLFTVGKAYGQGTASTQFEKMVKNEIKKFDAPVLEVYELKKMIDQKEKIHVLDARETEEYEVSHIKDSVHIGYKEFDISSIKKIEKNQKIVVYCSIGYRSGDIATKLRNLGYQSYNLFGGIFDWKNKGFKVFDSSGKETEKVHTYNRSWSKWLIKGDKVY